MNNPRLLWCKNFCHIENTRLKVLLSIKITDLQNRKISVDIVEAVYYINLSSYYKILDCQTHT